MDSNHENITRNFNSNYISNCSQCSVWEDTVQQWHHVSNFIIKYEKYNGFIFIQVLKLYCLKDNFYSYLTRHSLEFLLKNSGSSGTFQLSQKSPDGVRGHIINPSVILHSGQFVTVKVDEIKIPTYRQDNIFSLMVKNPQLATLMVLYVYLTYELEMSCIICHYSMTNLQYVPSMLGNYWIRYGFAIISLRQIEIRIIHSFQNIE